MNVYSVFKHIAFKFDPETIHDITINSSSYLSILGGLLQPMKPNTKYQLSQNGFHWSFPVGVAAGFDKNAQAIDFFYKMGFGAVEVGTVTKKAQIGNGKPRIFRHENDHSLRNAMGFPNSGAEKIYKNLTKKPDWPISLGVNIGKNKTTSEADTPQEYCELYELFAPVADYLTVNISSPNTPGLRQFQSQDKLRPLLQELAQTRAKNPKPCLVKISPDMEEEDIKVVCELVKKLGFSGVIATNTTIQHSYGVGGMSGKIIKPMAKATRSTVCQILREDPSQTIIGVGGIDSYDEIREFWIQGGSFTQIYTSFIYHGPKLLKDISMAIEEDLNRLKLRNVQELCSHYQNFS